MGKINEGDILFKDSWGGFSKSLHTNFDQTIAMIIIDILFLPYLLFALFKIWHSNRFFQLPVLFVTICIPILFLFLHFEYWRCEQRSYVRINSNFIFYSDHCRGVFGAIPHNGIYKIKEYHKKQLFPLRIGSKYKTYDIFWRQECNSKLQKSWWRLNIKDFSSFLEVLESRYSQEKWSKITKNL